MPSHPRTLAACLLLTAGACTCFEQKRTGPLPAALLPPTPEERVERRREARPPPTPLTEPGPEAPVKPVAAVAAAPASAPVETAPVPAPAPAPAPEETQPPGPRFERVTHPTFTSRKPIDNLRALAPSQRTQLLRSPTLMPRKLQKGPEPVAPPPEP